MARYNEIIAHLDTDPDSLDPVFLEGDDGQVIVTDSAAGFMDAVILRAKAWTPILVDEEGRALMLPLLVLRFGRRAATVRCGSTARARDGDAACRRCGCDDGGRPCHL